jgi:hypothetical protein
MIRTFFPLTRWTKKPGSSASLVQGGTSCSSRLREVIKSSTAGRVMCGARARGRVARHRSRPQVKKKTRSVILSEPSSSSIPTITRTRGRSILSAPVLLCARPPGGYLVPRIARVLVEVPNRHSPSYSSCRRHQYPCSLRPRGRPVESLVHAPETVQSARVRRVRVVGDAILERERAHAGSPPGSRTSTVRKLYSLAPGCARPGSRG